jgi:hypothetical protein
MYIRIVLKNWKEQSGCFKNEKEQLGFLLGKKRGMDALHKKEITTSPAGNLNCQKSSRQSGWQGSRQKFQPGY